MSDSLVIDISSCNNVFPVVEVPVGSGNYQATFEVTNQNCHNIIIGNY